jgi:hypothetical protein
MNQRAFQAHQVKDDCGLQVIKLLNTVARDAAKATCALRYAFGLMRDEWKTSEISHGVRDKLLTALSDAEEAGDYHPFGAIDADLRHDAFQAARMLVLTWAIPISARPSLPRYEFEDRATWAVKEIHEHLCALDLS